MTKLNQVIAIEKGVKSRVYGEVSDLYKTVQKPQLFNGFAKHYEKKDDDGEDLPPERLLVQLNVNDLLRRVATLSTELMDVTARKDWTNCSAKGDIIVDGQTIASAVPASFLLFLEKQLTDLRSFVGTLPILDSAEDWTLDVNSGLHKTDAISTHRTKKTPRPLVLYQATEQHPAQTQVYTEDVIVGFWKTVKHSGAMPKPARDELATRVEKLLKAVKEAREAANMEDVPTIAPIGTAVFGYLLGD